MSYKEYDHIGGKLKIKVEISDMPRELMLFTSGYFRNKAILFIFFDLSRPNTFRENEEEQANVEWLMGEVNTYNRNADISIFLVGINGDRDPKFDKTDAFRFAEQYKMTFIELNCNDTTACDKAMRDAVVDVCNKMNSGKFVEDKTKAPREKLGRYGIMIQGERHIIDNPPKPVEKKKEDPVPVKEPAVAKEEEKKVEAP